MSGNNTTYQDIADYTGFSKTTISRYFNRPETVKPENRETIRHALEVLNYKSNKVAQILAKGETEFIGLIIPNMYLSWYGEIVDRFLRSYERYGYKFIIFNSNGNIESEKQYINELISYHVEGLIMLSHVIPSFELASYDMPVVSIEREDLYINSVNTDNYAGASQATRLLADCGCDLLIHINRSVDDPRIPAFRRIDGFRDVCTELGIQGELLSYYQESSLKELEEQIRTILEHIINAWPDKRKGIFCSNDMIANILLNELFRRYGKLPEDFKLVGFDGSWITDSSILPLSTVEQKIDKLVDNAMELLIEQIESKKNTGTAMKAEPVHRIVMPQLLIKETT